MVQDIEHFRTKLQLERLVDGKVTMNRKIHLSRPKTSQEVPRHIPLPKRKERSGVKWRIRERGRIKSPPARTWRNSLPTRHKRLHQHGCTLGPVEIEGLSRNQIGPNVTDGTIVEL